VSTGRFMACWAVLQGLAWALSWGLFWTFVFPMAVMSAWSFTLLSVSSIALAGLLQGVAGSRLLARHRRPVRTWVRADFLGAAVGAVLAHLATKGIVDGLLPLLGGASLPAWFGAAAGLVFAVTLGGIVGFAEALALWGRRWPKSGLVWLPGRVLVAVLGAAAGETLGILAPAPGWSGEPGPQLLLGARLALAGLLIGSIEGAGIAWLLDRCEFKRAPDEAPRT
jgi:hypothetical protein